VEGLGGGLLAHNSSLADEAEGPQDDLGGKQRAAHSFPLFLIASLLISWVLTLLVALVVPARE
jgi:hypothetical protein